MLGDKNRLLSVDQLCELHPALNKRTLREWLYKRHENGLDIAVVKLGKRLFILEDEFIEWAKSRRESK